MTSEQPVNTVPEPDQSYFSRSVELLTGLGFGAIGLAHALPQVMATVVVWTLGEMLFVR